MADSWKIVFGVLFLFVSACSAEKGNQTLPVADLPREAGMIRIPGGTLQMGDEEEAAERVPIQPFWMDETEVTNAQFAAFVAATGYITVAEREISWEVMRETLPPGTPKPPDELLQPGALVFFPTEQPVPLSDPSRWWRWVIGASWRHPEGPDSDLSGISDHPVVQIAWEDAMAYAEWTGKRLPTEAEWEWAARGGQKNTLYPWGNDAPEEGTPKANFWQGLFPYDNTLKDKFYTTAPIKSFPPNGYGLYDMAGNVWEWCSDWIAGASGQQEKVLRGGSFLCNDDYCSGYRNSRRMGSSPDTGLNHTGFRCVKTAD